jgi:hypothetical protein
VLTDGSVALWDSGNARVNLYAADGTYLTQWMPPVQGFSTSDNAVVALADGGLALRAFVRDTTLTREALGRVAWFRFDASGTLRDTVLAPFYGDPPQNLIASMEGNTSSSPVPFLARPVSALDHRGHVVGSPGSPFVVYLHTENGLRRIERELPRVAVSSTEQEQRRALMTWNMRRTDPKWTWNGPAIPDEKPPVIDLEPALDDQLLVSIGTPSEPFEPEPPRTIEGEEPRPLVTFRAPVRYELFGADARLRGRFRMPRRAQLYALRGQHAWGTALDSLDVPSLIRWRLEAPPTARP